MSFRARETLPALFSGRAREGSRLVGDAPFCLQWALGEILHWIYGHETSTFRKFYDARRHSHE